MNRNHELLKDCFKNYINHGELFKKWFILHGKAYFFLFKKNLKVTNIQFAELISLIRLNAFDVLTTDSAKIGNKLQFLSTQQFNYGMREVVDSFLTTNDTEPNIDDICNDISRIYGNLLNYTVVVDNLYGSCAIYLPPGIDINLDMICASSGYIHSCGRNILIRNVSKFKIKEFREALEFYLDDKKDKIFFSVYAHEDFSDYDRDNTEELKNGLDDIKIYEEKYFMGKLSIVSLLNQIQKQFNERIIIPPRGNFKEEHKKILEQKENNIDRKRTLWLIIDNSVKVNTSERGDNRYYICYEQLYINENQYQIFDENKPAWKSSTTMPHTLTAAMINIVLGDCPKMYNKELATITACDPFVGTGTTWLECLKYKYIETHCSDLSSITDILINDNLQFFSMSYDELNTFKRYYSSVYLHLSRDIFNPISGGDPSMGHFEAVLMSQIQPLLRLFPKENVGEFDFDDDKVEIIRTMTLQERFLIYILLRVKLKYKTSFQRSGKEDIRMPIYKELKKILSQLDRLLNLKKRNEQIKGSLNTLNSIIYQADYSLGTSIDEKILLSKQNEINDFIKNFKKGQDGDINNLKHVNCFDFIITDPPYGFNSEFDIAQLAENYQVLIRYIIRALKDGGQVIMALPDKSFSGKNSPFFTHKEIVLQQFFRIADEEHKEIINTANILPDREIFRAPFYWEAEKALRRSIIHLKLRNI